MSSPGPARLPDEATPALTPDELAAAARHVFAPASGVGTARLLSMLFDDSVAADELLRGLSAEPALVARVLKVANSPFYRRSGTVGTLERSVQVLGLTAIRGIAAAGCMDHVRIPTSNPLLSPLRFQRHSLAIATAAQAVARQAGTGIDSEAFMAGLLHDLGFALLAQVRMPGLLALASNDPNGPATSVDDERTALGADHGHCTAVLVRSWGLPLWLADALESHHGLPEGPPAEGLAALPAVLALAEHVTCLAGVEPWPLRCTVSVDACTRALQLEPEHLADVAAALPEAMQQLGAPGA